MRFQGQRLDLLAGIGQAQDEDRAARPRSALAW